MNAKREEGRAILVGDRRLSGELFGSQSSNFAATAPAGGERHHQNGPVAYRGQIVAGTGREQFAQNVAGDGIGTLAASRPVDGMGGEADG